MSNLLKDNKKLMEEYNYEKNKDIDLENIKVGAHKKIWWKCSKGHEWEAFIYCRAGGNKCPICANQKVLEGYNDLSTTKPELAKEWDYDKNELNPEQITKGSNKIVWWKCPKCHNSYEKSVNKRNSGEGCPYCSGHRVLKGYNDLKTWCINNHREDLIKEYDTKKNNFKITDITFGSGKNIWWICPNGHSYKTTLHHRINMKTGCGKCSHKVFESGINDLLTTNPELAKEWDYEKNSVRPTEVMAGSNNKKYWFICPKGHSYKATLLNRKKGRNCPICSTERHTSFPEKAIYYYMSKYFSNVKENYHSEILGTKEIDIFLEDYKIGIEYDGRRWHKDNKRDLEKDIQCYKSGIKLIRIREIGCSDYNSESIKKYILHDNVDNLKNAIQFIIDFINKNYNNKIVADINIDRDRIEILELMNLYEKENSIANYFPEIKKYWDNEKNGKIKPEQISHSSIKTIYLKCEKGHEWETCAHKFSSAPYCPICSGHRVLKGYNDLFTTNPEIENYWSIKNKIDPQKIKSGSNKIVFWKCPSCGNEWSLKVIDMVKRKRKCRKCQASFK